MGYYFIKETQKDYSSIIFCGLICVHLGQSLQGELDHLLLCMNSCIPISSLDIIWYKIFKIPLMKQGWFKAENPQKLDDLNTNQPLIFCLSCLDADKQKAVVWARYCLNIFNTSAVKIT